MTKETMTNQITVEKYERDKGQNYWWKSPEIHKMLRINQTKTVLEVAGELDNKKNARERTQKFTRDNVFR